MHNCTMMKIVDCVQVPDHESISTVKTLLQEKTGVPPCQQEIRGWQGNAPFPATDRRLLSEMNLPKENFLYLLTPEVIKYFFCSPQIYFGHKVKYFSDPTDPAERRVRAAHPGGREPEDHSYRRASRQDLQPQLPWISHCPTGRGRIEFVLQQNRTEYIKCVCRLRGTWPR